MSVLAVAVKHLVALGMSGDALDAAIEEMLDADADRKIAERRLAHYQTLPAVRLSASGRIKRRKIGKTLRMAVIERDGSACVYCGCETDYPHLDHRIPASRGGENSLENLCVACEPCNLSKGALTPEEWAQ